MIPIVFSRSLNLSATMTGPEALQQPPNGTAAWISTKQVFQNFDFYFGFVVKQPSSSLPPILQSMYPTDAPRKARVDDLGPTMDSPPRGPSDPPAPLPKAPISRERFWEPVRDPASSCIRSELLRSPECVSRVPTYLLLLRGDEHGVLLPR